ncbi:MAG: MBL fold metallo-hydrolase [Pseudomonadales bacterium]
MPMTRYAGALLFAVLVTTTAASRAQTADATPFCGDEGVWIQILGAGGPELDDTQGGPGYLVFADNAARVLVDTAPGASVAFDKAGGRLADLEAVVFTQLTAHHSGDFPAFVEGALSAGRDRDLPVFGPDGAEPFPGTRALVDRLIGARGAYAYLAGFLSTDAPAGFRIAARDVPTLGRGVWTGFHGATTRLAAVPVHHGPIPALAWRVHIGDKTIVFTGDFSNRSDQMAEFAAGADALVIHHAVPEGTRGEPTDLHVTPSQIGRIAARADVRMVILGHRTNRTRGFESISRGAIAEHYEGAVIFANDLECWGL